MRVVGVWRQQLWDKLILLNKRDAVIALHFRHHGGDCPTSTPLGQIGQIGQLEQERNSGAS